LNTDLTTDIIDYDYKYDSEKKAFITTDKKRETFTQLLDSSPIQSNINLHNLDENNDLDIQERQM